MNKKTLHVITSIKKYLEQIEAAIQALYCGITGSE